MKTTSQQRRAYQGPVIFSPGFRPFFFGAGLQAPRAEDAEPVVIYNECMEC